MNVEHNTPCYYVNIRNTTLLAGPAVPLHYLLSNQCFDSEIPVFRIVN